MLCDLVLILLKIISRHKYPVTRSLLELSSSSHENNISSISHYVTPFTFSCVKSEMFAYKHSEEI